MRLNPAPGRCAIMRLHFSRHPADLQIHRAMDFHGNKRPARRPCCATCLRPASTCICRWVTPVSNLVDILVLQHPSEVGQAKGSARLLQLSMEHCRVMVGESFEEEILQSLLGTGSAAPRTLLLYPSLQHSGMACPPALDPAWLTQPARLRLVVLDATWRKSLKILYCNPLLQALPRLALHDLPSAYLIRKAHRPDQLSTLEATCHALMQIERQPEKYQPLLHAFDGFVGEQLSRQFSCNLAGN